MTVPDPRLSTPERPQPARPTPDRLAARRARRLTLLGVLAVALLGTVLVLHLTAHPAPANASQTVVPGVATTTNPPGAPTGSVAPSAPYTTPQGTTQTLAAYQGKPLMVWFVAGGCASCAVSIPTVAHHLAQLRADGIQVLTLGLPEWFAPGHTGLTQLLAFGRAAAGRTVPQPGWAWGMPSTALVRAFDPSGTPDVYYLLGPHGHVRYHNSVPASTITQLLAHAKRLATT
ncbi:hypothetical protein ACFFRE_05160 [Aciditerrimonas ferrireducens]|uniref:Thioredoxin domain-containing protein n=1 Tax=Aciditerrimonas ferrireducens TaxID=667306 RepID=A0ABV6C3X0_9ACTN